MTDSEKFIKDLSKRYNEVFGDFVPKKLNPFKRFLGDDAEFEADLAKYDLTYDPSEGYVSISSTEIAEPDLSKFKDAPKKEAGGKIEKEEEKDRILRGDELTEWLSNNL